jgi:hypothetical protein
MINRRFESSGKDLLQSLFGTSLVMFYKQLNRNKLIFHYKVCFYFLKMKEKEGQLLKIQLFKIEHFKLFLYNFKKKKNNDAKRKDTTDGN